uniref:Uncharacterized protein n=1 Tax=Schistocephalus solidus TaxID=70667 RepID=A0A0X3P125_SCHSO
MSQQTKLVRQSHTCGCWSGKHSNRDDDNVRQSAEETDTQPSSRIQLLLKTMASFPYIDEVTPSGDANVNEQKSGKAVLRGENHESQRTSKWKRWTGFFSHHRG